MTADKNSVDFFRQALSAINMVEAPITYQDYINNKETTTEAVDKSALKAWHNKYKKYQGNNGDELPTGMLLAYIDTGILTDGVETNEFADAVEKLGGDRDKAENKLFSDEQLFSKLLPITDAMQNDYMKAMGVSEIDEDNSTQAAKILGDDVVGFGVESMDMNDKYASHLDNIVATSKHEQGPEIEEGNEFAQKVRELKAKGAKPGTKFKTSDGEEHTLEDAIRLAGLQVEDFWSAEELMAEKGADDEEDDDTMDVKIDKDGAISKADAPDELHNKEEEELPLDEFIKGHFDYTTNQFPKGETAVMTAVEKKYGDEAMKDAMNIMKELVTNQDEEMARIKTLAGVSY